ncbi:MAG: Rieske 2Fe-2S domain-containing protein [Pirellulales bacterium]|nr:Rieske 2Fe-2S domain-containing protein [Pirellulales bacterium]
MAAKKKMSVEEILAAARKGGSSDGGASGEDKPGKKETESASEAKSSEASEKPKPVGKSGSGERPSVADILAAARSKGGGNPEAKPAAKKPIAKPVAKKSAEKPMAAKPAAGAMSTSSILDAARGGAKRGPVSKGEGTSKDKPAAPVAKAKAGKLKLEVPPMPEKPGYAKPAAKKGAKQDRRGFLSVMGLMVGTGIGVGFTSLTMTMVVWTLGLARYLFPNIRIEPPSKFKVGFPTDIAPGVVETKYKAQYGVWVVNAPYNGEQAIFALSTVCTHLGCTPNWLEAEQKFKCPCHGSGFYVDGINFEGPAPRPLERYAISVAGDGQLEVDKSVTFQQEKGDWDNPASFVPA